MPGVATSAVAQPRATTARPPERRWRITHCGWPLSPRWVTLRSRRGLRDRHNVGIVVTLCGIYLAGGLRHRHRYLRGAVLAHRRI